MTHSPAERLRVLARSTARVKKPAVRAVAGSSGPAKLYLYDFIDSVGGDWGISAREFVDQLNALGDVDEIELHINSPGGDVFEAITIRNALRQHDATVTTVVDGLAASAASFVAVAGDQVVMAANSELMIHDALCLCIGNATELREIADRLEHHDANIASMYAAKAGGDVDDWLAAMDAETWFTAAEAVESGLADRTDNDEPTDDDAVKDRYDLTVFAHAGRSNAPTPRIGATHQPPAAPAPGSPDPSGREPAVAFSDEQITTMRQKLELSDDADEAAILDAVTAIVDDEEQTPTTKPGTPAVPEGMTLIENSVLEDLRTGAADGRQARQQQQTEARDAAINAAIRAGKTTPARLEHWQNAWNADPEGTRTTLDGLAPGLVPVNELGHAEEGQEHTSTTSVKDVRESDAYKNWSM